MISFAKVPFIIFTIASMSIFAQQNKPAILDVKNEKTNASHKNEKVKYFLQFGIMAQNHRNFQEKYGISIVYENCVITKFMAEKARKNNQEVSGYLTKKYGEGWKKGLEIIPYGL